MATLLAILGKLPIVKYELFVILTCAMVSYKTLIENQLLTKGIQSIHYVNFDSNTRNITEDSNISHDYNLNVSSKQQLLYQLPIKISSHNYQQFNSNITINHHTFEKLSPSLLIRSFTNKRIIFFGDSTVYKFYIFIVWCLDHYIHGKIPVSCQFGSSLINQNHEEWSRYLNPPNHNISEIIMKIPSLRILQWGPNSLLYQQQTINTTLYMFENRWDRKTEELFSLYHSWIDYKPDIIFWNPFGLHLLHLTPLKYFQIPALDIIGNFHRHLTEIFSVATQSNAIMIYRGTSPLCYIKDHPTYKKLRSEYKVYYDRNEWLPNSISKECIEVVRDRDRYLYKGLGLSQNAIEICQYWSFTNEGVLYQNQLMKNFVNDLQKQNDMEPNNKNVFFYDRYRIFHEDTVLCTDEARDTAHWQPSYGADAMYFANTINLVTK